MEDRLKMAKLMTMIADRQGDESINVYARKMGLSEAALSRYYNAKREINLTALRKMSAFYSDDSKMLAALAAYALNVHPEKIEVKD